MSRNLGSDDSLSKTKLMETMDSLNERFDRGTICVASVGSSNASQIWSMKQERVSQHYTTKWNELPVAKAF
jgi:DNA polymerase V